jgi:uncharacterized protein with NRDE domain
MCLVALAIDQSRRFPLVLAANRDEFLARPAARLAWWTPSPGAPAVLGGRDLEAGGTWLGLTAQGRLACLTNVRDGGARDADAPSRGRIVADWLAARERTDRFWMRTALSGFNRFNLIAADFAAGECFWASNDGSLPQRLERGLYGLSNAALDTPWPKVQVLKARMRDALAADTIDGLCEQLFAALADPAIAEDGALPSTGVPIDLERALSPAFIRTDDGRYGTRCTTLVVAERVGRTVVTHMVERSFASDGTPALQRHAALRHWPPRPGDAAPTPVEPGPVIEEEVGKAAPIGAARRRRETPTPA